MNTFFDPNWYANALGLPLIELILFPIGTLIVLFIATRIRMSDDGTLIAQQKPQFIIAKFGFGFVSCGVFLVLLLGLFERYTGMSLSPLPEYFGLMRLI